MMPIKKAYSQFKSSHIFSILQLCAVQLIPSLNLRNAITRISSCFSDALERLANEGRLLQFVSRRTFVCFFKYCCPPSAECPQDHLCTGTPYVEVYEYSHRTYVVLILPRFHLRQVKRLQGTRNSSVQKRTMVRADIERQFFAQRLSTSATTNATGLSLDGL